MNSIAIIEIYMHTLPYAYNRFILAVHVDQTHDLGTASTMLCCLSNRNKGISDEHAEVGCFIHAGQSGTLPI